MLTNVSGSGTGSRRPTGVVDPCGCRGALALLALPPPPRLRDDHDPPAAWVDGIAQECRRPRNRDTLQRAGVDTFGQIVVSGRQTEDWQAEVDALWTCLEAKGVQLRDRPPRVMTPAPGRSTAERLEELQVLRQEGVITEDGYQAKRRAILEGQ